MVNFKISEVDRLEIGKLNNQRKRLWAFSTFAEKPKRASGAAGIKYSSTLELRPPQTGPDSSFGFVWPEDRLPVVVEETFEGIKAFFKHISENP